MTIRIVPCSSPAPGKLADAELQFDGRDGILVGLKLVGFAIWQRANSRSRYVSFPTRTFKLGGETKYYNLLRTAAGDTSGEQRVRDAVLKAYAAYADEASGRNVDTSVEA